MRAARKHIRVVMALLIGAGLAGIGVGLAQREAEPKTSAALTHPLSVVFRDVAREAMPSVVSIHTRGKAVRQETPELPFDEEGLPEFFKNDPRFRDLFRNRPPQELPAPRGQGSGFIIDESGVIMTSHHVVTQAEEIMVRLHDGREFKAVDVKTDPRTDVAILRIEGADDLQPIKLGNSDDIQIGDWVLAIGSPFGLELSVTQGIISAKGRGPGITEREDFLQTDAAINPGNSGGPLLNLNGEVIGINTAISSRSGGYEGIGFAVPISMARWVGDQLVQSGKVKRGYLGVSIQAVTNELARQFDVKVGQGAIVGHVMPNSPAAKANLEPGDVIVEFAGKKVNDPRSLQAVVEQLDIGKKYPMTAIREGEEITLQVAVEEMPGDYGVASLRDVAPAPSEGRFDELGFEVKELTAELARQLGMTDAQGALVISVDSGSPAEDAGLKPGDVIEKVAGKSVKNAKEMQEAVENASTEEGLLLHVRSEQGKRFVVIKPAE